MFNRSRYRTAKAIDIEPNNANALLNLGIAYANHGMLAEAIIAYKRAILVNPKNSSENYNVETAYRAQGRLEEAIAAYRGKSTKATV